MSRVDDVRHERERQIAHGYTLDHDEQHGLQHLLGVALYRARFGHMLIVEATLVAALELQGFNVELREMPLPPIEFDRDDPLSTLRALYEAAARGEAFLLAGREYAPVGSSARWVPGVER